MTSKHLASRELALTPSGATDTVTKGYVDALVTAVTKTSLGLGNVDNTSDATKNAAAVTLTNKTLTSPVINSPTGIVKGDVGLGSVDNTADTAKPVSTAQQTALNLKANIASPTFTGTVGGITKAMVGLSNVDNTTDIAKPVSTATQTQLDLKAPLASPAFTGTPTGITKTHVGLGNVDNTSDATKNAAAVTLTNKTLTSPIIGTIVNTGTLTLPTSTDTLVGRVTADTLVNKTLTAPVINSPTGLAKADVGLGNVDNTSNATERAAVATLTNKTLTAPVINSPTGIAKGDVGLVKVYNTSNATERAAVATLTNKTISGSSNTLTNIGSSALTDGLITEAKISSTALTPRVLLWSGSAWPDRPADSRPTIFVGGTAPTNAPVDADLANGDVWIPAVESGGGGGGSLPTQTGNSGYFLTTNGTSASWLDERNTARTLTNARIVPRSASTASSATPTINTDVVDTYGLTAQAANITSFTTNLSGTPGDGQQLWIYIVGTAARTISWGTSFENGAATLPTTTVLTQRLDVGFVWNAGTSKWRCMATSSA